MAGPLAGCAQDVPAPPSIPAADAAVAAATARTARAQSTIDAFLTVARRGDSAAAADLVSARAPAFPGRAAVWAANLHQIAWSGLSWIAQPMPAASPSTQPAASDTDAWVQPVRVTWALPGESRASEDQLRLIFVTEPAPGSPDPVTRLAGIDASAAGRSTLPIWLQQPVRLYRAGGVLLLADPVDAARWLGPSKAASRTLAEPVLTASARDGAGPLVVEVARSRAVFERALGVESGSYAAIAAVAWPRSPRPDTAPIHVVVNAEASRRLSEVGRDVLLTHEAVHVATRSPASSAPTWLVEGCADLIAYQRHPGASRPAELAVQRFVRKHGVPADWPSEPSFKGAEGLDLAYDLAWTACRSIAAAQGAAALDRFYAAAADGRSLEAAARAIGTTEQRLRARWRADLEGLAGR